jgi:sugar phosphate isomerase/epimerase
MLKVISTHVFLRQRLHPGLLEQLARSGAHGVELFAARQHFDYTNEQEVRELAEWFRSNQLEPFSMHAPLYPDREMGRGGAPGVNVVHVEKSRRIDSMDEIKRALETAEYIPFKHMVLHLGDRQDEWSLRTLEHVMSALEHLKTFASPLGVTLLVENLQNDVTAPEHILEVLRTGHFTNIGVCLDVGHAHLGEGVAAVMKELKPHIRTAHLHDNQADKDSHLWPGDGTIAWDKTMADLKAAPEMIAGVLEIHYALGNTPEQVETKARATFERLGF